MGRRADTDELVADVIDRAAGAAPGESLDDRYRHSMITLSAHLLKGANGGTPKHFLLPNHPWARSIIKWVVGGAFALGVLYAGTTLAVKNNTSAIESHDKKSMHDGTAKEIGEIKTDVARVKDDVGDIKTAQTAISNGIESLKKERVEELKEELKEERRRNRRNRRGD